MIKPLQSITLKNDNGEDTTYVVASAPAIVETTEPADVASFSDGAEGLPVSSLIADINPVQNLNGQSAPYPAGGGKNLINVADVINATITSSYYATFDANFTLEAEQEYTLSLDVSSSVTPFNFTVGVGDTGYKSDLGNKQNLQNGRIYITFTPTAQQVGTYNKLYFRVPRFPSQTSCTYSAKKIMLVKGTDTTFAPYSNICPITGWTGMNVVRTGINIWDGEYEVGAISQSTGQNQSGTDRIRSKNYIRCLPNTEYKFSFPDAAHKTTGDIMAFFYDENKNYLSHANWSYTYTFTTVANAKYMRFFTNGSYGETYNNDISINYPATDTDYHAYNGTTYPISWADEAGTVYGGTLDVTNGLLTVTHGIVEYDGSADESWTKGGGANECYIRNDAVKRFLDYRGQLFCDKLATYWHHATFVAQYGISAYGANDSYPSQNWLYVHLTDTTLTVADLKTWLQSNPITVCYPLATPQTYQLTPQAVLTILGQNNIWADTGDVEAAYCADTKLYIDKVIAAL